MMFDRVLKLYTDYIRMDTGKKLRAGEHLAEAARLLLAVDRRNLDLNEALQRQYLMRNIAGDLLGQMVNMAHTKEYDCAPDLEEYTRLAFDLMYELSEGRPDRRLLPFIPEMIRFERFHSDAKRIGELKELLRKAIDDDRKYLEYLNAGFFGE